MGGVRWEWWGSVGVVGWVMSDGWRCSYVYVRKGEICLVGCTPGFYVHLRPDDFYFVGFIFSFACT